MPMLRASAPISTLPETTPFVELRRAARRRDDTIKAFRAFMLGAVLGASSWGRSSRGSVDRNLRRPKLPRVYLKHRLATEECAKGQCYRGVRVM